jgi:hypothetical protein
MSAQPGPLPPLDTTNELLSGAPMTWRAGGLTVQTPVGPRPAFILTLYGVQGCFTAMFGYDDAEEFLKGVGAALTQVRSGILVAPPDMSLFRQNGDQS